MRTYNAFFSIFIAAALMSASHRAAQATPMFSTQIFATGAGVGSTGPDSLAFGSGSLWAAYTNGADSTGASGSSLVVRYSPTGMILKTFPIAGSVDGLRIDTAGNVWALQNQDANSALTVINPNTNQTQLYSYGSTYTAHGTATMRGFDEAAFRGGQTFLSVTNPALDTDPVIVKLISGLTSPLQISGLLQSKFIGTNLVTGQTESTTITDPDSLKVTPLGDLALTGEGDKLLVFVRNVGLPTQSVSFLPLLGTGKADDPAFPTGTLGTFYVADTGANTIYAITATGLLPNSVFVSAGDVFGSLDTTTGIVTPVLTGVSPHGAEFVASGPAEIPEPGSLALVWGGLLLLGGGLVSGRLRQAVNEHRDAVGHSRV